MGDDSGWHFGRQDSSGILEFFIGQVVLAKQVDVAPGDWGIGGDDLQQPSASFIGLGFGQLPAEIEIVPADDAVLDQPVAGFGDLLLLFFGLNELAGIADGDGTGKAVGQFDFVELLLNGLPNAKSSI